MEQANRLFPGRCSVDVIYGRPGQTLQGWIQELQQVHGLFYFICRMLFRPNKMYLFLVPYFFWNSNHTLLDKMQNQSKIIMVTSLSCNRPIDLEKLIKVTMSELIQALVKMKCAHQVWWPESYHVRDITIILSRSSNILTTFLLPHSITFVHLIVNTYIL